MRGVHPAALTRLPPGHRIGLVAGRCGFFREKFSEHLESEGLPYIIVARLTAVDTRCLLMPPMQLFAWVVCFTIC